MGCSGEIVVPNDRVRGDVEDCHVGAVGVGYVRTRPIDQHARRVRTRMHRSRRVQAMLPYVDVVAVVVRCDDRVADEGDVEGLGARMERSDQGAATVVEDEHGAIGRARDHDPVAYGIFSDPIDEPDAAGVDFSAFVERGAGVFGASR